MSVSLTRCVRHTGNWIEIGVYGTHVFSFFCSLSFSIAFTPQAKHSHETLCSEWCRKMLLHSCHELPADQRNDGWRSRERDAAWSSCKYNVHDRHLSFITQWILDRPTRQRSVCHNFYDAARACFSPRSAFQ